MIYVYVADDCVGVTDTVPEMMVVVAVMCVTVDCCCGDCCVACCSVYN